MKNCSVILTGALVENGHMLPEFKECSDRAELNSQRYGGLVQQKYMIKENLGNGGKMDFVFVVEYPSYEDAIAAHSNAEYQQIKVLREKVFREFNVLVAQ